jgi:hypothetical protein
MDRDKYDAPEPKSEVRARAAAIGLLALAVVVGMVLIATGAISITG